MEKEKLALGGSVFSAIAASLCCIGPLVAVIVGASGFAAAGLFAQSRPLFLAIAALLLAAAWYLTYRHAKAGSCSTEGCPQNPVAKRSKVTPWLVTAFVIAIAVFPDYSGAAARLLVPAGASDSGSDQGKLATLQVNIPSMDCGACAVRIQAKLNKQDGVEAAQVDFATKAAVIHFDPGKLSPERVTALIDETGFKAESKPFRKNDETH
jgi:mercuric ion transport protein